MSAISKARARIRQARARKKPRKMRTHRHKNPGGKMDWKSAADFFEKYGPAIDFLRLVVLSGASILHGARIKMGPRP